VSEQSPPLVVTVPPCPDDLDLALRVMAEAVKAGERCPVLICRIQRRLSTSRELRPQL
jgi:hypothetical protein